MKEILESPAQAFEDLAAAAPLPPSRKEPIFAAYLTHELRAPLTAIRLGLEIIQEQAQGRLGSDEKQMLELAVKNTKRLGGLIDDILDYTKIEAGKMPLDLGSADPRVLIAESIDGLQSTALSKGVRLIKEGREPLASIHADSRRIVQIMTNLLSNAIKFSPRGGCVTISASEGKGKHRGNLIFKVKDAGCGIAHKDLDAIFHTFEQTAQTRRHCQGTGLGLSLAKLMVELHGGRIWVESQLGNGATFFFTIPLAHENRWSVLQSCPKEPQFHGLVVELVKRVNAFIAAVV